MKWSDKYNHSNELVYKYLYQ